MTRTPGQQISRRLALGSGAAAAGLGLVGVSTDQATAATTASAGIDAASVARAASFLAQVTDAYRTTGPRLAQSYYDGSGLNDLAFIYDNALAIIALIAAGDIPHARAIADGLRYARAHDADRSYLGLRQTYHADTFTDQLGNVTRSGIELDYTSTGDMAWSGMAFAHLFWVTRIRTYAEEAVAIGQWILRRRSSSGLGGYTFGTMPGLEGFKGSEHNIDVYAFFRMLTRLTGDAAWEERARHAWFFVGRMWNPADGFYWTGSNDGSSINKQDTQLPLDVQTWAWLANILPLQTTDALDWAATNLAVTDTPLRTNSALTGNDAVSGVTFASGSVMASTSEPIDPWHGAPDTGAVWLEGTCQLALARYLRLKPGDLDGADGLMAQVRGTQDRLGAGQTFGDKPLTGGLVATTSPLQTGFKFGYYPHLCIAATSWYVMAGLGKNPFRL